MSNASTKADPRPGPSRSLAALVTYRRQIAIGLFVLAALLAIIPITSVIFYSSGLTGDSTLVWGVVMTLLMAAGGVAFLVAGPQKDLSEADTLYLLLLTLGGLMGIATVVLGLVLPFREYSEVFGGGVKAWRENPWRVTICLAAVLSGLVLIFASLQLARGQERTSLTMRRLIYGYNALLTSFLLLAILVLINLLPFTHVGPFAYFDETFNWTASGIYKLSPATRNFLSDLKQPVQVVVLMPERYIVTKDVETLLENCRGVNNLFSWKEFSPQKNYEEVKKYTDKYLIQDPFGLLVIYGEEKEGSKANTEFIKAQDLATDQPSAPGEPRGYLFKGEAALLNAMRYLSEGKAHSVVYFTQGSGEPSFTRTLRQQGESRSLSVLKDKLGQGNYEVKELTFGPEVKSVPADAALVVVVRPTQELPPNAVTALRDYLKGTGGKAGKLMVLLDVVTRRDGGMVMTGLEPLLSEYNVRVGINRILAVRHAVPTQIQAVTNPDSSNPVAKAFNDETGSTIFVFEDARTVDPGNQTPPNAPGGNPYTVESLMLALPTGWIWAETDLGRDPAALVGDLRNPDNREKLAKTISPRALSVAVTVATSKGGLPQIPGHEGLGKEKPVMVVFGDAGWVTDKGLSSRGGRDNFDLFVSCLAWLRERSDVGKPPDVDPKSRKEYQLNVPESSVARIKYLPLGLIMLGVLGLGCGVWVVRRR